MNATLFKTLKVNKKNCITMKRTFVTKKTKKLIKDYNVNLRFGNEIKSYSGLNLYKYRFMLKDYLNIEYREKKRGKFVNACGYKLVEKDPEDYKYSLKLANGQSYWMDFKKEVINFEELLKSPVHKEGLKITKKYFDLWDLDQWDELDNMIMHTTADEFSQEYHTKFMSNIFRFNTSKRLVDLVNKILKKRNKIYKKKNKVCSNLISVKEVDAVFRIHIYQFF